MPEGKLITAGLLLLGIVGFAAALLGIAAVVSRYLFALPLSFSDEIVTYLIVWGFLLGVGLAEADESHIRATILLDLVSPTWRRLMVALSLVLGIGFALLVAWYGMQVVQQRHMLGEVSATVLRFPQWVARLCIPVGFGIVVIAAAWKCVALIRGRAP